MKLVAWNLNHKASERVLKPAVAEIVSALRPDILVLNEYVHGEFRPPFVEALNSCGLEHVLGSERLNLNNQVLINSRHPLSRGDLGGPATEDKGGESNFLHVLAGGLEIAGVRVPAYTQSATLREYWQQFAAILPGAAQRRIVFLGDFNADPRTSGGTGDLYLASFIKDGWSIPEASGEWIYSSGTRVDHALLSPSVVAAAAQYVTAGDGFVLAGRGAPNAVCDHAALVVELAPSAA